MRSCPLCSKAFLSYPETIYTDNGMNADHPAEYVKLVIRCDRCEVIFVILEVERFGGDARWWGVKANESGRLNDHEYHDWVRGIITPP